MNHTFCDFAEAPPKEMQGFLKNLIACRKHEREEAVFLCKDHDVTCCSKCETADHRKCKEVKVLSDTMKGDCSELKTGLRELQQQGEILLEQERKHMELISESENKALSWLETTKQKLLAIYNQHENELLSEIAGRKKLIGEQIQAQNEKLQLFLQDIQQQSDLIENVEKFGTNSVVRRRTGRSTFFRFASDDRIQLVTKFGEDRMKLRDRPTDRPTDRQSDSYIAPITNGNGGIMTPTLSTSLQLLLDDNTASITVLCANVKAVLESIVLLPIFEQNDNI
ncbi:hypothetical protein DPMN_156725 [Dreissena polymorpha]|uniref:B box-type domain-containing protein n=1 Tax=Dreissena polymorpha TaxID=45954 RepID=A0A9D4FW61_DREPO|nr:hypothetical protein DPMN_156725 [Dreissena polymorpha]